MRERTKREREAGTEQRNDRTVRESMAGTREHKCERLIDCCYKHNNKANKPARHDTMRCEAKPKANGKKAVSEAAVARHSSGDSERRTLCFVVFLCFSCVCVVVIVIVVVVVQCVVLCAMAVEQHTKS